MADLARKNSNAEADEEKAPRPASVSTVYTTQPLGNAEGERKPNPLVGETRAIREAPLTPAAERAAPPQEGTRIYGPSFLGLNDSYSEESSDYLLEDEPSRSASPVAWLLLLVLVGLGAYTYFHWGAVRAKAADYAERYGLIQKPQPAADVAANTPSSISTTNAAGDNNAAESNKAPEQNPPGAANENADAKTSSSTPALDKKPGATDEADDATAKHDASSETASAEDAEDKDAKQVAKPESDEGNARSAGATSAEDSGDSSEVAQQSKKSSKSKERKVETEDTSSEAAAPTIKYDNRKLELAQKYLQGKGVEQNCDLGLRLLRSAADEPNPHAKIQMGALYLTGHCVQQDQAEAYHWFSQAYSLDPRNSWVEKNLTEIWARMTPEERERAQH